MQKKSEIEGGRIWELSNTFANQVLGNEKPDNMCFTISYPLSLYLKANRIDNLLTAGNYIDDTSPKNGRHHFWIALTKYENIIVDPTIQQFFPQEALVHVGVVPETYEKIDFTFDQWFDGAYERWRYLLLNNGIPEELPPAVAKLHNPKAERIDINILLRINLRAALLLFNERENILNDELYRKYFVVIIGAVKKYLNKNDKTNMTPVESLRKLLMQVTK